MERSEEGGGTRARLVSLLAYPIALARDQCELHDCQHAGFYDGEDRRCAGCGVGLECEWLMSTIAPEARSRAELAEALEFAVCYVDAYLVRRAHRRHGCTCPACRWLEEARAFTAELDTRR